MSNHNRGFGVASEGFRWGPSLPAFPRVTAAANGAASGAWERPLMTRSIQLDAHSCVAVSRVGDELSDEDLLGLLEQATEQLRAALRPRARLAA